MIKALGQQVLVKPLISDEKSAGGIIVPDSYKESSNKVRVVSVGDGSKIKPMNFTEGEVCFRVKDSGTEVVINEEKHFLVDQGWLLAKLK